MEDPENPIAPTATDPNGARPEASGGAGPGKALGRNGGRPLESLLADHRDVERLVLALRHFISTLEAEAQEPAARADLADFIRLLEGFVDEHHHEKEEAVLLPYVVRSGLDWDQSPVTDVRREHRQERYLIGELRQAVAQSRAWSQEDRRHLARTAQAVVDFEHSHLLKENTELFPLILRRLAPDQLEELRTKLIDFDCKAQAELEPQRRLLADVLGRHLPAMGGGAG